MFSPLLLRATIPTVRPLFSSLQMENLLVDPTLAAEGRKIERATGYNEPGMEPEPREMKKPWGFADNIFTFLKLSHLFGDFSIDITIWRKVHKNQGSEVKIFNGRSQFLISLGLGIHFKSQILFADLKSTFCWGNPMLRSNSSWNFICIQSDRCYQMKIDDDDESSLSSRGRRKRIPQQLLIQIDPASSE